MGFNTVYQTLKELFPQVDARLLKAVAIEHTKDLNGAVESILVEILPFMNDKADVATPAVVHAVKINGEISETPSSSTDVETLRKGVNDSHMLNDAHNDCDSLASSFYDANDTEDLQNTHTRVETTNAEASQEISCYVDAKFTQEHPVPYGGDREGETSLTHSGQICNITLLEDIIQVAKNYKDELLTSTESVLRLIEDVENQEKEAEQAKAAAAKGGLDIYEKVEEIKKMLKHAKEANEMHAGEVYGEKSVLATELRELQSRLLGLADEKERSLTMLDEMQKTLEARKYAAEEERKAAEREMLEKQRIARSALAEQELIMEKVVRESKLLRQEAEQNAKLRDFLMKKGHIVDELQGEISVICQDVKSLKENFDNRVSLSKSLSIEQTSFRLASSTSSVKSVASDPAMGLLDSPDTSKSVSPSPSVKSQTPRSNVGEDAVNSGASHKDLLDEDWELFEY